MTTTTQNTNETIANEVVEIVTSLELLNDKSSLKDVIAKVNEIITKVNAAKSGGRNRGPESTREMTEEDARRIMLGDLKAESHKLAAEKLGLSYGQIYSARGGYTFKAIYKEANEAKKKAK